MLRLRLRTGCGMPAHDARALRPGNGSAGPTTRLELHTVRDTTSERTTEAWIAGPVRVPAADRRRSRGLRPAWRGAHPPELARGQAVLFCRYYGLRVAG